MKVNAGKTEYTILRRLKKSAGQSVFLARCDNGPVLLIRLSGPVAGVYPGFTSDWRFRGFLGSFTNGRELWLRFEYISPVAQRVERAARGMGLRQSNALARSLMERVRDMPWPVLRDIMRPGRVFAVPDGDCRFLFALDIFPGYERDCRADAMERLSDMLSLIYGGADYPAIAGFINALRAMRYTTMDEVCSAFRHMSDAVENMPEPERESKPETVSVLSAWLDKAREFLKKLWEEAAERAVPLIAAALLLAGYIALGRAVYSAVFYPPTTGDIAAIGTVELYDK